MTNTSRIINNSVVLVSFRGVINGCKTLKPPSAGTRNNRGPGERSKTGHGLSGSFAERQLVSVSCELHNVCEIDLISGRSRWFHPGQLAQRGKDHMPEFGVSENRRLMHHASGLPATCEIHSPRYLGISSPD